ncbi:anti-sigma-F factor Fin family protein [Sediminibacillus massiliensis]|uniref:anti-sigma-F factor Fin family protein n=1 Tax=Sediminibacillus massiliensis TaxID=1926277 RepID=UPI00098843D5|nr:anti-sigma-F factor Fin family protein [Sediminibacillus massiliensis]
MSVVYRCNHCGVVVGQLDQQVLDTEKLGWNQLSQEERAEMINYQQNGDIHIKTICENCEDTFQQHPHYHELDFFIQ